MVRFTFKLAKKTTC